MNSSLKFWVPAGYLSEGQAMLLAVPATAKPDRQLYLGMLAQDLVDQSPQLARTTLEMSQEQAPELWQIAQEQPHIQWGISQTNSHSMASLLSRLDWTKPGKVMTPTEVGLEIHPQHDMPSLLEQQS